MTGWLEWLTEGLGAQMRDGQMTDEHVMRKDVILARARKKGLKERPVAILGYLLTAGKATVAECEVELKMNRRTLQRDLKLLVEKGLVREIGTGPSDPTKYYQPLLCFCLSFTLKTEEVSFRLGMGIKIFLRLSKQLKSKKLTETPYCH